MSLLDDLLNLNTHGSDGEPQYLQLLREDAPEEAVPLLRDAMRQDDAQAMAIFGTLLALGRGIEQDIAEATLWFRQAAVRGHVMGQAAIGTCLAAGMGVEANHDEAAYWLWQAAQRGASKAAEILSDLIMMDSSVVGEHFTMDEFYAVYSRARKATHVVTH